MRTRQLARAIAAVALVLTIASCGSSGGSQSATGGSPAAGREIDSLTLVVPLQGDALDTTKASIGSLGVLLLGLEPLVRYDAKSKELVPNVADSFEQQGRTYRFELRGGVKFWDGAPLRAEDVVFSFDLHRGKDSESFIAQQWSDVTSVRATGPSTITVKLASPNPQFAYTVAQTGILSKAYYEENRARIGSPGVLNMGTGPYRFESFTPSAKTVLVRNDGYWGKKPPIRRLDLRTISDDSTRLLALQSGDADGVIGIPLAQLDSFREVPELEIASTVDYSVYKFNFDLTKKPWDDVHLRRAFAHVVDRDAIANGILKRNATAGSTLVPPTIMEALVPPEQVEAAYGEIASLAPAFDLAKAKEELSRSSMPDGFSTTLLVTGSDPNLASIAQTVGQNAKEIGIDIQVKQVDDNTYYNAVYFKHTTEGLSLENFGADGPDASNIPSSALDSRNGYPQGSGVNVSNYESAAVDRVLRESRQLKADDPARGELLLDALDQAARDLPFVPLAYPKIYLGLSDEYRWDGFDTFWWLTSWPEQVAAAG
jgi:peptide/nickel transport system substrate-binding protein